MRRVFAGCEAMQRIDDKDRAIIAATQAGLPLVPDPWAEVARITGLKPEEVLARMRAMAERGIIRRIGLVPNHYWLGWTANGMSVWDVPDEKVDELGAKVGALPFVTHCYLRPRSLPEWPYNLFAMVHGRSRAEVEGKVARIHSVLRPHVRAFDVLYSTRILKKAGLRIRHDAFALPHGLKG